MTLTWAAPHSPWTAIMGNGWAGNGLSGRLGLQLSTWKRRAIPCLNTSAAGARDKPNGQFRFEIDCIEEDTHLCMKVQVALVYAASGPLVIQPLRYPRMTRKDTSMPHPFGHLWKRYGRSLLFHRWSLSTGKGEGAPGSQSPTAPPPMEAPGWFGGASSLSAF